MVDDPPVYLFWNTVVITAVPGFHMKDRYSPAGADNSRESAVCVTENEDPVWPMFGDDIVDPRKYLSDLLAERGRSDSEVYVRRPNTEVPDKDIAQAFMKVLTCMDGYMLGVFVEHFHHAA
jgi:hypothetical protein